MSEYNMSYTGAELDDAINKVKSGYILPSETINITENKSGVDITNGKTLNVNVPQGMLNHTRIQKTIGSSDTLEYSISLSEIGFTPKAYSIIAYPADSFSKGDNVYLLGLSCDMDTLEESGSSTSGTVLTAGGSAATVGISTSGTVNGDDFKFSGTYAYFRASTRYRFFFWG